MYPGQARLQKQKDKKPIPEVAPIYSQQNNQPMNNQGYPPQNAQPNAPYPPQYSQYPPQQQGPYPPQQQGNQMPYPPQNQGYPPQQQQYPPQNQGYPPQNNPYPPQQQPYPPHSNQGYPPQQQSYPPQQAYPPQSNQPQQYPPQAAYPPQQQQQYPPPQQKASLHAISQQSAISTPSKVSLNSQQSHQSRPQQVTAPYQQSRGGNKKALLIGINYFKQKGELRGCLEDVKNVNEFLKRTYGFPSNNIMILTDDQKDPSKIPTKQNMLNGMAWLVQNAQPGDSLFFHYSGHGGSVADASGDEDDGFDETICPVDYKKAGQIVDDDMHKILVKPLQKGVKLTVIFDSCHSGTALDLPYMYLPTGQIKERTQAKALGGIAKQFMGGYGLLKKGNVNGAMASLKSGANMIQYHANGKDKEVIAKNTSEATVIMFSGCKDLQYSADTKIAGKSTGAMSHAFISVLQKNPHPLLKDLLGGTRNILKGKYQQIPQLSTGHKMDMNQRFDI